LEYHAEAREFFPYSEDENDTHGLTHATWDLLRDTEAGYDLRKQLGPVFLATAFPDFYDVASPRIDTRISVDDYQTITDMVEHQIHQASWGCRLFVTDSEMFGTGLSGIMDGDVVCILFGSEVPYILRPTRTEGQYLLIGECYIDERCTNGSWVTGAKDYFGLSNPFGMFWAFSANCLFEGHDAMSQ
jgi:hypothetical protein